MIRPGELRNLIADEQAGREDRAKQIWQLLTLELWYRNVRSAGVAA
jgi:asparagine synthase (glutamine-hydrolysing)